MRLRHMLLLLPACVMTLTLLGEQQPVFRTSVQVVEVTVIATDAKGLPASGLNATDFHVWDNGKEQATASFEKLSSRAMPVQPQLPPDIYSNRIGNTTRPQVISMILLDAVNTRFRYQVTARRALERILEQIRPDERVAIFALGSRFQVLHDFSSDKASLLARLKKYRGEVPLYEDLLENPSDARPRQLELLWGEGTEPAQVVSRTTKILSTIETFEAIANYAKDIPGRKNLLWLSAAFPMSVGKSIVNIALDVPSPDFRNFEGPLDRGIAALNNANVSVYPIDARGLIGGREVVGRPSINFDSMKRMAKETGGTAFYNSNDFDRGLRAALDDSREVYLLTYYPKSLVPDGSFHSIRVQTSRPGVRLRYRRGYYAATSQRKAVEDAADRLVKAMSSPLDVSGIGLRASVQPRRTEADDIGVVIQVDAADLNLTRDNAKWTGKLRLEVIPTGATGDQHVGVGQTVQLDLTPETYQRALEQGLRFEMKLKREPAAIALRVGVIDARGGRVGSLMVPLASAAGPPSTR
jgi:VWFA-related protein